ncbi:unnamed protein product [Enterobius vermicularis]|uniref:AAA_8 domain-containing protein n=1 Tax=Enterobius vermicularis TaxID=51028 RepID=A0A0N4UYI6_ENTVE|nr:unnamed protein product [Enterobius vermicularis]
MQCTAHTKAEQIHSVLRRYCLITTGPMGRVLKPKCKPNLVMYIKSVDLIKPDKWGTSEAISFLQQLLTYRGYYDENLEWIFIENVQFVLSVSLSRTASSSHLPHRFKTLLRICHIEFPSEQDLMTVYSSYLSSVLQNSVISTNVIHDSEQSFEFLMPAVIYETCRTFLDRLASENDKCRFKDILYTIYFVSPQVAMLSMGSSGSALLSPIAIKEYHGSLQKSANRYEFEVAQLNSPLFDDFVSLCSKLDRILTAEGGSTTLVGKAGVGRRAAASLVAHIHQMKTFTPQVSTTYGIKQFNNDLKQVEVENYQFFLLCFLNREFLAYINY